MRWYKIVAVWLFGVSASALLIGCSSVGSYQSQRMYDKPLYGDLEYESIRYEGPERNPVIVIPGFLGSELLDKGTGDIIWGHFRGTDTIKPLTTSKMYMLAHPMGQGPLRECIDDIVPGQPLDHVRVQIGFFPFHLGAYHDMLKALEFGGYYAPVFDNKYTKHHYTCFTFGYDWRRDVVENAERLHAFIQEKRAYLQEQYEQLYGIKNYNVQFVIVAHSMGGLLARYYLYYGSQDLPIDGSLPTLTWEGAATVDKVIIVGTPNAGYLDAFCELVEGLTIMRGITYEPTLVGTFPSLYEMMPVEGSKAVVGDAEVPIDIFDPQVWIKYRWGLADPRRQGILEKLMPGIASTEERAALARNHLRKCLARARQFTAAMSIRAEAPPTVSLHLFAGNAIRTSERARVHPVTGKIKIMSYGPGDGKVLSSSARFDERLRARWSPHFSSPIDWTSITFLFSAHMGLTRDPVFQDNMLFELLERYRQVPDANVPSAPVTPAAPAESESLRT